MATEQHQDTPATEASVPGGGTDIHDAPIVPEDAFDDGDSAVGDEASSYTTSLASSVENYPVEYGRRYHAYQDGRYTRPNDDMETDRLTIVHTMITTAIDGLYLAPIDKEKPHRILDIGTGPGTWAMDMGDLLPNATIIGNDLSANMPTFVPPNVKFEVDDVENEWVYDTKFTYIFSRYMAASILDWPKLVGNVYANLEPGGWAEFQDFDLRYYSEDGSLADKSMIQQFGGILFDAVKKMGRDSNPGVSLEGWAKDAGFKNVVHKRYKLPVGPWPKDPKLKEIGLHNYMQVTQGLEGISQRLFLHVLKWSREDMLVLLAKVRKELADPNIHSMFDLHVVYGQKPE